MPDLSLSGLVKAYGAARALDGAALKLRGGEVHALMGENGAGKSTLIKVLAGLVQCDAGAITLDGRALRMGSAGDAAAAGLRFLHQELQVVPGVSVAENMFLGRDYPTRLGLVRWRALRAVAAAALVRLGVGHIDVRGPMGALGPGDQMLVRIAATLIEEAALPGMAAPWLYVFDEPTAALSGAEADRLFGVIAALKAAGAAILYVSHRMEEVMRLADRITVLRDGVTVASHGRGQADPARIIADMTGRSLSALFPARLGKTGDPVLRVAGLAAGNLHALSLDLRAGEIVGLAGLAGSGRNAALKALIGAIPRRGQVTLGAGTLGAVPLARTPAAAWAQGLAYVPRERRAEGVMLGRPLSETVALPHLRGVLPARRAERRMVAARASEVRLKATGPAQPVGQLSGGNQQKVLFARALAGTPRVLLLDEPTRGVDVGAKADIYALIRARAAAGVAVLIASSDLPELIGLCDRIAVLHQGHMTGVLPTDGLTEGALLAACYQRVAP